MLCVYRLLFVFQNKDEYLSAYGWMNSPKTKYSTVHEHKHLYRTLKHLCNNANGYYSRVIAIQYHFQNNVDHIITQNTL